MPMTISPFAGYTLLFRQNLQVGKFSSKMKMSWLLAIDLDTKKDKNNSDLVPLMSK